ncbi:MAG: LysR family transcriptional regulator [Firmicutes bacterium]|nr:LysR family transcriptional regulator [Bacillota bacterium]
MRIDQFIYLTLIDKLGSISLAAEHLHISQPTISQAISALEKDLGIKLFYRSRLGTIPTEDGKIIIKKAKELLNKIEEMKEVAHSEHALLSGRLSIATIPTIAMTIFPKILVTFKNRFPGVNVDIFEAGSLEIEKNILNGQFDIGFISIRNIEEIKDKEDLFFEEVINSKIMACVGQKSPLSPKKSITFKEIVQHPILMYNPQYKLYSYLIKQLNNYGEPNILLTSNNTESAKRILAEGIGIGFCNNLSIINDPYFQTQRLIPIPISDEDTSLITGWIRLKSNHFPPAAKEFIKMLKSYIHIEF